MERLTAVATVLLLAGCAAKIQPEMNVTVDEIREPVDTLAILPVTAASGLEGFRRQAAQKILAELEASYAVEHLIAAKTTGSRLSEAGLASDYSEMVESYQSVGVLDGPTLKRIADAVGADYLLATRISYTETEGVQPGMLTPYARVTKQGVNIFAHVWHASKGQVVWEGVGRAQATAGEFSKERTVEEIMGRAARLLVTELALSLSGTAGDGQ